MNTIRYRADGEGSALAHAVYRCPSGAFCAAKGQGGASTQSRGYAWTGRAGGFARVGGNVELVVVLPLVERDQS